MKTNQTPLILEMDRGTYVHGLKIEVERVFLCA